MIERSFFHESRDLYRLREYLIKTWVDSLSPRPIVVVEGEIIPQPLPPMPDNFREVLDRVNDQIASLMAEHLELREREQARRYHYHSTNEIA